MNNVIPFISSRALVVSDEYRDPKIIAESGALLKYQSFVKLPRFLSQRGFDVVDSSLNYLHGQRVRKDFTMPYFGTERRLSVVGGSRIINLSLPLMALYANVDIRQILSRIIGQHLHTVTHRDEFMVANFLDGNDNTHGWHTDDPEYALILITEAPSEGGGGALEFIPHWNEYCADNGFDPVLHANNAIAHAENTGHVRSAVLKAGDCYLLHANNALHRVAPIIGIGRRKALNMAFDTRRCRNFGETANLLYAS